MIVERQPPPIPSDSTVPVNANVAPFIQNFFITRASKLRNSTLIRPLGSTCARLHTGRAECEFKQIAGFGSVLLLSEDAPRRDRTDTYPPQNRRTTPLCKPSAKKIRDFFRRNRFQNPPRNDDSRD